MVKLLVFLSPLATLFLAWLTVFVLMFFAPWVYIWPVLVLFLIFVNYRGIRYALGHRKRERPWHYWACAIEWVFVVLTVATF